MISQLRSSLKSLSSVRQLYDQLYDSLIDAQATAQAMTPEAEGVQALQDMIDAALEAVVDNVNDLNDTEHSVHRKLALEMKAAS